MSVEREKGSKEVCKRNKTPFAPSHPQVNQTNNRPKRYSHSSKTSYKSTSAHN